MSKRFALTGIAGYIAPRHLKAIKDIGGELIAAYDISDRVGILDSYFPDCVFFTDEFAFYDYLRENPVDYLVVCSPNYLHVEHCYAGLKLEANVICEKPLALTLKQLEQLQEAELYTNKHIYTILQLRLHPMLLALKQELKQQFIEKKHEVVIEYYTPRGKWYQASWKGNKDKSGGLATNIGIHLFDLAVWLFGDVQAIISEKQTDTVSTGMLQLQNATVRWHLSIEQHKTPKRQIIVDGKTYEFTDGFSDLHTASYEAILNQQGFTIEVIKPSVEIVEKIRGA